MTVTQEDGYLVIRIPLTAVPVRECRLPEGLTLQQMRVFKLVQQGKSNKEIGSELYISQRGVKFHVSDILRILGARSRYDIQRKFPCPESG